MAISDGQIEQAYLIASKVYDQQIKAADGARQLESQHGLSRSYAKTLFGVFRHLLHGESFKWAGSAPAMDYFISQIALKRGQGALGNAVAALQQHIENYEKEKSCTLHSMRNVLAKHKAKLVQTVSWAQQEDEFRQTVEKAMFEDPTERQQRLAEAPKLPKKVLIQIEVFRRNPDVVAEVLLRAKGKCERCQQAAPFKRKSDGTPYLEVHHKRQLADDGEDTVENAEALCPNCHRKEHFGISDAAGNSRTN